MPVENQGQSVAILRFVHKVSRNQHGDSLRGKPIHAIPKFPARNRIDAGGRLVEKERVGLMNRRRRKRETLFIPEREGARLRTLKRPKAVFVQRAGYRVFPRRRGKAVKVGVENEILPNRQIGIKRKFLRHIA